MTGKIPSLLGRLCLVGVCSALLAGCAWLDEWDGGGRQAKAPQPVPQSTIVQTADATWIKPVAPQQPMERLVPVPDETIMETRQRLEVMEAQLANMQNDMKMIMPALTRLAALQVDVQALAGTQPGAGPVVAAPAMAAPQEMAAMNYNTNVALKPVPLVPTAQPRAVAPPPVAPPPAVMQPIAAAQPQAVAPPPTTLQPLAQQQSAPAPTPTRTMAYGGGHSGAVAQDIRFGTHPDKTRIVIDVSKEIRFFYKVDGQENVLQIALSGARWAGPAHAPVEESPLIMSYNVGPDGQGGTQMALQLSRPVKVLWAETLPSVGNKGPRLVIDIAPL